MTKLTTCSANVTVAAAAHFLPGNSASSPERSWMQVQVPVPQITARGIKVRRIKAVNHLREVKRQSHRM
ncbi:hypothetical protein PGIGA_G00105880 [Pangasianodon gigas]|uniref:Uncharacterized protein n=1 Tax=Pangasianodon gigas TaxID=30993 RepID=A0ACC5W7T9_PANGG|nr:hypothetical protein [Pangasianodon gigas]